MRLEDLLERRRRRIGDHPDLELDERAGTDEPVDRLGRSGNKVQFEALEVLQGVWTSASRVKGLERVDAGDLEAAQHRRVRLEGVPHARDSPELPRLTGIAVLLIGFELESASKAQRCQVRRPGRQGGATIGKFVPRGDRRVELREVGADPQEVVLREVGEDCLVAKGALAYRQRADAGGEVAVASEGLEEALALLRRRDDDASEEKPPVYESDDERGSLQSSPCHAPCDAKEAGAHAGEGQQRRSVGVVGRPVQRVEEYCLDNLVRKVCEGHGVVVEGEERGSRVGRRHTSCSARRRGRTSMRWRHHALLLLSALALAARASPEPDDASPASSTSDQHSDSTTAALARETPASHTETDNGDAAESQTQSEVVTSSEGGSTAQAEMTSSTASEEPYVGPTASNGTATSIETSTAPVEASPTAPPSSDPPSPPSVETSSSSPPEPSTSVLPDLPVVEELPLTEAPPAPEFLSFNEWRERYAVAADPSIARRAKKAAQRARQDVVGSSTSGTNGAAYDGDGADLGSLFAGGEEAARGDRIVFQDSNLAPGIPVETVGLAEAEALAVAPTSDMANPIQPLPDVGTGEPNDPLLHLKDRSNYAAFECAAMVHRSSRQSKGASSILVEKKDRYMLTPCSANPKFVDVELCDEIQIDTLVLANFEFFSSTFKHFKASCSVDYPGKPADWHDLGTFRARNVRGIQVRRFDRPFTVSMLSLCQHTGL